MLFLNPVNQMLDCIEEAGRWLSKEFHALDCDSSAFAKLAVETFERFELTQNLTSNDIIRQTLLGNQLPIQVDPNSHFGEPAITLFHNPVFYIDAYHWFNGTTAIHNHAFAGAFAVLQGSSLETTYTFITSQRIGSNLRVGQLEALESNYLSQHAIRPINPGNGLIHSVFHLEEPSISLCIRTPGLQEFSQQNYYQPGIAMFSICRKLKYSFATY